MLAPMFVESVHTYFRGEKTAAVVLAIYGLALLGWSIWIFRSEHGGFMWGLGVPLVILGLAGIGGGIGLYVRTEKQVPELVSLYERDPAAFVAQELPRMEKVQANWPRLKIVWSVLLVVALAALAFWKKDWAQGLALAFVLIGATGMMVDVFAERRANLYFARVQAIERD
jgi:hypothetical protein